MSRANNIINEILELNDYERDRVLEVLKNSSISRESVGSVNEEVIKNRFNMVKKCPFCGNDKISKHGKYHGLTGVKQRYKCQNKECNKTFNEFTKSAISNSKKGLDKWLLYAQCMIENKTIRECAKIVGINIATAFYWRHKIIDAIRNVLKDDSLQGIIELNETYFPLNYKGNHTKGLKLNTPKESRKHRKKVEMRRISRELICVLSGVDRSGNIYSTLLCNGKPKNIDIDRVLNNVIEDNSILCMDKHKNYIKYNSNRKLEIHQIRNKRKTTGAYNIEHIRDLQSSMKIWMHKFRGVSTKFLINYLFWHKWTELFKNEIESNKAKKLFIHANSIQSTSLIKDFKSREITYA